uniref:Reverse transcriptase domain-containing protein n=1 Tax=Tanacetum cinerariifolium TaxID=118510 RepID=A0A6L2KM24_TANCI|nr:reverse transcriptase domain-containing protein [Tanacetum cinerariifolium]
MYKPTNDIKGKVLADFLSEALVGAKPKIFFHLPVQAPKKDDTKRWTLFTDEESNSKGFRAGLVLINPSGVEFTASNGRQNKGAGNRRQGRLEVTIMIKYLATAKYCMARFKSFTIHNIPINSKQKEDVLSKLATIAFDHLTKKVLVEILSERSTDRKELNAMVEDEEDNWMMPIIKCLREGVWLEDKAEARALRMKINQYVWEEGFFFKKGYLIPMLRQGWEGMKPSRSTNYQMYFGPQASLKQSNGETPFSLTYGSEAERREVAAIREAKDKTKMEHYYNQRVKLMSFKPDEYVFRRNETIQLEDQGKLWPKWEGPYRVIEAYQNGSYKFKRRKGKRYRGPGMLST